MARGTRGPLPLLPAVSGTPRLVTGATPVPTVRYGGFWIRFVAVIIDGILVGIVVWPVALIMTVAIGLAGHSVSMPGIGINLVSVIVRLAS